MQSPKERDDACLASFVDDLRARGSKAKTIESYGSDLKIFRRDVEIELLEVKAADVYRVVEACPRTKLSFRSSRSQRPRIEGSRSCRR